MPILTVIIPIKNWFPLRINAFEEKETDKGRSERDGAITWLHVALIKGITPLDKYHIHITKKSIRCSCGHASSQRLTIKFSFRRVEVVLYV